MSNFNPNTGIAYGYVAANDLDGDVVHELMWGYGIPTDWWSSHV